MAAVGNLAVYLTARTDQYERGLRKAERLSAQWSRKVRAAGQMAAGAIALAGAAMASFVKRQMGAIDRIGKLSDALGESTENLVKLQHAAEITGVEHAVLEKSLKIMARRLGEVKQGTGEARVALETLGLSAANMVRLSPVNAFLEIAGALGKMETQAEKAAVANQVFGRSGVDLLNILDMDREALGKLMDEADKLGLTFSREMAAKVEEANDAMTRMNGALTGFARDMAIAFAPSVQTAIEGVTGALQGVAAALEAVAKASREAGKTYAEAGGMRALLTHPFGIPQGGRGAKQRAGTGTAGGFRFKRGTIVVADVSSASIEKAVEERGIAERKRRRAAFQRWARGSGGGAPATDGGITGKLLGMILSLQPAPAGATMAPTVTPEPMRASFFGLSELWKRQQQAAVSGDSKEVTLLDRVAKATEETARKLPASVVR